MATLTYATITSLDGFIADADGDISWGRPDAEVSTFVNELMRPLGTYLYGRRLYETMRFWETVELEGMDDDEVAFTELWRAADKVVYSRTLEEVSYPRTRLERSFDPASVAARKAASTADLCVGGADLAGQALAAGLVDDVHLFVTPVTVGGGTPALAADLRLRLSLVAVDRFASGVVHLHYRPGT